MQGDTEGGDLLRERTVAWRQRVSYSQLAWPTCHMKPAHSPGFLLLLHGESLRTVEESCMRVRNKCMLLDERKGKRWNWLQSHSCGSWENGKASVNWRHIFANYI